MGDYNSEQEPLLKRQRNTDVPQDKCKLVYMIFYLLGVGSLVPWNFFSNAKQYYLFKLRNTTLPDSTFDDPDTYTSLQANFESYLTIAAMIPNVFFMFLNAALTKVIPHKIRIVLAALFMLVMFTLTIVLAKIDTNSWQVPFFSVTIVTIVIINAGSAVFQGGMFGVAGMYPPEYTQAVMGGMGMGGVIAAVAGIISLWAGSSPLDSGFGYFLTAAFVVSVSTLAYLCLPFTEYGMHYMTQRIRSASVSLNSEDANSDVKIVGSRKSLCQVFSDIWIYGFSVFLLFFVTLSCYPAVNSAIHSVHYDKDHGSAWANTYFMPVSCFLLFNVGDLIGRTGAGICQWPKMGSKWMIVFAVVRIGFIPLFLFCNVQPRSSHFPVAFQHDAIPIILMLLFSSSNGYLGTLCMMYGPRLTTDDNMETAGAMMSFFLSLGLGVGAMFSLLLLWLVDLNG